MSCGPLASRIIVEEEGVNAGNEIRGEVTVSGDINREINIHGMHEETVVGINESRNDNFAKERVETVQDDRMIREGDETNVLNMDRENRTDTRLMDSEEDRNNDILSGEGKEGSFGEVQCETSRDLKSTSEKINEIEEQEDFDNLIQEDRKLGEVLPQESGLTSSIIQEKNLTDPGMSQVPSITEQRSPVERFAQEENRYENIHNIFGKQQGEEQPWKPGWVVGLR